MALFDKALEIETGSVSKIYFFSDNLFDTARLDGKLTLDTIIENRYKID